MKKQIFQTFIALVFTYASLTALAIGLWQDKLWLIAIGSLASMLSYIILSIIKTKNTNYEVYRKNRRN